MVKHSANLFVIFLILLLLGIMQEARAKNILLIKQDGTVWKSDDYGVTLSKYFKPQKNISTITNTNLDSVTIGNVSVVWTKLFQIVNGALDPINIQKSADGNLLLLCTSGDCGSYISKIDYNGNPLWYYDNTFVPGAVKPFPTYTNVVENANGSCTLFGMMKNAGSFSNAAPIRATMDKEHKVSNEVYYYPDNVFERTFGVGTTIPLDNNEVLFADFGNEFSIRHLSNDLKTTIKRTVVLDSTSKYYGYFIGYNGCRNFVRSSNGNIVVTYVLYTKNNEALTTKGVCILDSSLKIKYNYTIPKIQNTEPWFASYYMGDTIAASYVLYDSMKSTWYTRIDKYVGNGELVGTTILTLPKYYLRISTIQPSEFGGFYIAGWTYSFNNFGNPITKDSAMQAFICKVNSSNQLDWIHTTGRYSMWDRFTTITELNDGDIIVFGMNAFSMYSDSSGGSALGVRLHSNQVQTDVSNDKDIITTLNAPYCYPNPTQYKLYIGGLNKGTTKVNITDVLGKSLLETDVNNREDWELSTTFLPEGQYLIILHSNNKITTLPFTILR